MAVTPKELEMLYDKSVTCPVCGEKFKNKTIRSGKARMLGTEMDLRPKYEGVDPIKYDVVSCPQCGYTALSRFFDTLSPVQKNDLKEKIGQHFHAREEKEAYEYSDALDRYKLAMLSCMVKQAPDSERAYTCLKTAWIMRGMAEEMDDSQADEKQKVLEQEQQYIQNALTGFVEANMHEEFPIAGMDEFTLDYMIAALDVKCEKYDEAFKLLSGIIASREVNPRIKDKARDLKDDVQAKLKKEEAAQE